MSILIKGMEMPTNNDMAPTAVWVYPNGYAVVFKDNGEMKQFVDAVPVPPHVDLIDRQEAIIDANERAYDFWLSDDEVNATIQFLNEQTAIIPAEEGE